MHRVCKECPLKFKAILRAHRFLFSSTDWSSLVDSGWGGDHSLVDGLARMRRWWWRRGGGKEGGRKEEVSVHSAVKNENKESSTVFKSSRVFFRKNGTSASVRRFHRFSAVRLPSRSAPGLLVIYYKATELWRGCERLQSINNPEQQPRRQNGNRPNQLHPTAFSFHVQTFSVFSLRLGEESRNAPLRKPRKGIKSLPGSAEEESSPQKAYRTSKRLNSFAMSESFFDHTTFSINQTGQTSD